MREIASLVLTATRWALHPLVIYTTVQPTLAVLHISSYGTSSTQRCDRSRDTHLSLSLYGLAWLEQHRLSTPSRAAPIPHCRIHPLYTQIAWSSTNVASLESRRGIFKEVPSLRRGGGAEDEPSTMARKEPLTGQQQKDAAWMLLSYLSPQPTQGRLVSMHADLSSITLRRNVYAPVVVRCLLISKQPRPSNSICGDINIWITHTRPKNSSEN